MMAGGDLYMVFYMFFMMFECLTGIVIPKRGIRPLAQPVFFGMTTGEIRSNNLCTVMETTWKSLTQVS